MVFTPHLFCCDTIDLASVRLVNRNDPMAGGNSEAILAMSFSGITPGPLGILDTRPMADAP